MPPSEVWKWLVDSRLGKTKIREFKYFDYATTQSFSLVPTNSFRSHQNLFKLKGQVLWVILQLKLHIIKQKTPTASTMSAAAPANFNAEEADNLEDVRLLDELYTFSSIHC